MAKKIESIIKKCGECDYYTTSGICTKLKLFVNQFIIHPDCPLEDAKEKSLLETHLIPEMTRQELIDRLLEYEADIIRLKKKIEVLDDEEPKPCPNCKETVKECACMRNKCNMCGKPVGNITFSVCDECWEHRSPHLAHKPQFNTGISVDEFYKDNESEVMNPINSDGKPNKLITYCYKCGTNVRNQIYCHNCGRKLLWNNPRLDQLSKNIPEETKQVKCLMNTLKVK